MRLKRHAGAGAETKHRMRLEIKEVTAEGTFEGLLSPYGNVDSGGDVVEQGAYTKTLKEQGSTRPLLWQHRSDTPIGELTLEDRPEGLWCKGQLLMALAEAQKAYLLMKAGIVKGLSIGFESIKDSIESGVRHLKEVKLYEGSIVTFPMNEQALIVSVKGRETKGDFNEELNERQTLDGWYQMESALSNALVSVLWSDLTKEEKIAAAETVIEQFGDAFMAFLPGYLDAYEKRWGSYKSGGTRETKAGRKISAATAKCLKEAHGHMMSAADMLSALMSEEAGESEDDATSKSQAAGETKSEPGPDHSAVLEAINEFKEKLKWKLN